MKLFKLPPLVTGVALREKAQSLGIDLLDHRGRITREVEFTTKDGIKLPQDYPAKTGAELQQEIREHERSIREGRLWIVAVLSAVASIISAIAAMIAVLSSL